MEEKKSTWKGYVFLTLSVLVSLSMVLLDPIATLTTEIVGSIFVWFILSGTVVSIILAIISFSDDMEKKVIPVTALVLTLVNVIVILFFFWFGTNLA
ncbi:hypothetical protein [Sediminibacillus dalangtanensis]|nr:hypothetical protein [Sediminibacillus dalangtanensis]